MNIKTLEERIEKKQAQIERKKNTIVKKMAQIEKKGTKVRNLGYDPDGDRYQAKDTADHHEVYWLMCDINSLKEDIKRGEGEIKECEQTLEKYEAQLKGELEKEATFIKEVPQAMKDLEANLIERWDADDTRRREHLRKMRKELSYDEFIKRYHHSGWEFTYITDEDIHKANVRDARYFILDLLNRVKDITGEVTNWSEIYLTNGNNFPVLNGYVEGKEGRAEVESILAGGYNIQRLHIRTLVKAV